MTDPTPAEALATVLAHLQRGADRRGFIGGPSAADCRVAVAEIERLQESKMAMHDEFEQLNPGGHIRLDPVGCGISTYTAWIVRNNLDQLRAIVEDARKPYEHTQLHAVYRLLEHNLFTVFGDVMPVGADGKRRWPTEQDAIPMRVPLRGRPNGTIERAHVPAMTDEQIKHMVDRFLWWRLPEDFQPDCGINFDADGAKKLNPVNSRYEPTGTNLFDATQVEAMVRHMIDGVSAAEPARQIAEPHTPTREAVMIAAIAAAVKAVEDMGAEIGRTNGKSISVLGPVSIGVEVELRK